MARNYGIGFCERVLDNLRKTEDKMIEETGSGFDYFGEQFATEKRYRKLLKQFRYECENGLEPSYRPEIHGE